MVSDQFSGLISILIWIHRLDSDQMALEPVDPDQSDLHFFRKKMSIFGKVQLSSAAISFSNILFYSVHYLVHMIHVI